MTPAQAYRKVRTALQAGVLTRPDKCSKCGEINKTGSDGRATIQAHHYSGYDRPLDVEWLCAKCHRMETPLPDVMGAPCLGSKNGQAKLSIEAIEEIRNTKGKTQALATKYGVNRSTIKRARNKTLWNHIAAAPSGKEGA